MAMPGCEPGHVDVTGFTLFMSAMDDMGLSLKSHSFSHFDLLWSIIHYPFMHLTSCYLANMH